MRFNLALTAALFGATAIASQLNERFVQDVDVLQKRQQFTPTTTTAEGATCADAFGAGYVTCREASAGTNRLCYNPTSGQTCCSSQWACPSGSFCLVSGTCCPNGQDAATCAKANGVSLSSGFSAPTGKPAYPAGNSTGASPTGATTAPAAYFTGGAASEKVKIAGVVGAMLGAVALL